MTIKEAIASLKIDAENVGFDTDEDDMLPQAKRFIEAVKTVSDALESPRDWTPCADGQNLPQSEKQVLLTCISDNKRIYECKGYYLAKHSKEIGCADDLESDYDEETDRNYCPEGFYECIENWGDYSFVYINDTVLAWQPLPTPYNPDHIRDAEERQ